MMKLAAHLSRSRHGIFYFRWPLPGPSDSRLTLRLSLQTRCPNRAGLLARHLASFGHDLSASLNKAQMRYQDIRQHVQKMMSQELALRLQQLNEDGPDGLPLSRGAQNTRDLIAAGASTYWDTVGEEGQILQLTKFAAASGVPVPEVMAERDKILPLIFQGLAALIKEFDSRKTLIEGIDLSGTAPMKELGGADVPTPTESGKTLAEVVALLVAEQVRVGAWVVRTRAKREATLGVLVELIGGDTAMDQITKKHAQDVKAILLKLPPNKNKHPLTRDLSLREAANVPGLEPMSTVTLNGYLSDFHTFTEWAARNGYGKEKLFDGMTVRAGKRSAAADEAREAFSEEATALMVEELNRNGGKLVKKECYRWASLLGIFTGARLNEICGLRVADVQEIDGILCISINDEDPDNNKSLKTVPCPIPAQDKHPRRNPILGRHRLHQPCTSDCAPMSDAQQDKPVKSDRAFNPQYTTRHEGLRQCLADVVAELGAIEGRTRQRTKPLQEKFANCVEAIVLDLFRARLTWPWHMVGIGAGRTSVSKWVKSQYTPDFLTTDAFLDAFHGLEDAGHIVTPNHFVSPTSGQEGKTRRFRLSDALLARLTETGGSCVHLELHPNAEGIHLKNSKKKLVEYGNVPFAEGARKQLQQINDSLAHHWYDVALPDDRLEQEALAMAKEAREDLPEGRKHRALDFSARSLHRVFNNGAWDQGGRFYGGWWQNMRKHLRKHITIDGKETVEVDFSGLNPAMLFAKKGLPIPDDPYAACMEGKTNNDLRDCIKRTFNALLNASSVDEVKAVEGFSKELTGKTWRDFKAHVVDSFPDLREHIATGQGIFLQYEDSQMAEEVMLHFAKGGYPCLPVHDSFIVILSMRDELRDTMLEVFQGQYGQTITAKAKSLWEDYTPPEQEPDHLAAMTDFLESLDKPGHAKRLEEWRKSRRDQ